MPISLSVEHASNGPNRNRLRSRKMSRAAKVEIEAKAVCNGARLSNGRLVSEANSELLTNDLARARMSNLTVLTLFRCCFVDAVCFLFCFSSAFA
jgi:hypothetical protein